MRAEPKENGVVVLKHDELNPNAQPMVITGVTKEKDGKTIVQTTWITRDGVPYNGKFNADSLEKYNPKRVAQQQQSNNVVHMFDATKKMA